MSVNQQVLVSLGLFSFLLSGCSTPIENQSGFLDEGPSPLLVEEEVCVPEPECHSIHFEAEGIAFLADAGQSSRVMPSSGASFVEAEGLGFPAPNASNPLQKKLTAQEAARYRALAKLTEEIGGLHVTRSARVQDMAFAGEEISVSLSGQLQGVVEVRADYDESTEIAKVTLRVALDEEGKMAPHRGMRLAPHSIYLRKTQAEAAAKIRALASLREQIGQVYVTQSVQVKNLMFEYQEAQLYMEGILEQVSFSRPRWISESQCEVTATVDISREDLKEMQCGDVISK